MPEPFSCQQCGKTYAWKPELAGKKVRCACGHVMVAPQAPAPPAQPEKEDLYDLVDDPTPTKGPHQQSAVRSSLPIDDEDEMPVAPLKDPPKAKTAPIASKPPTQSLRPAAAKPMAAGAAASRMRAQPTRSHSSGREDLLNEVGGSPVTELYVPAAMLGAGLMLFVLSHLYQGGRLQSLGSVIPAIGLGLLLDLVLSFAGIFMVARIWEVSFGAPGPAVLKLCACALLPPALATLIGNWVGSDSTFVSMSIRSMCMMPLALVCFMFLFRLAIDEAFYCMVVIYLINEWVVRLVLGMILTTGAGGHVPVTPAGA